MGARVGARVRRLGVGARARVRVSVAVKVAVRVTVRVTVRVKSEWEGTGPD